MTHILPQVSRFAPDNSHAATKAKILNRLRAFFDRYLEV